MSRKLAGRLRGEDGHLFSRAEELRAIIQHSLNNLCFAVHNEDYPISPLAQDLVTTHEAFNYD